MILIDHLYLCYVPIMILIYLCTVSGCRLLTVGRKYQIGCQSSWENLAISLDRVPVLSGI